MFHSLTVKGSAGSILWGYRPAVSLRDWTIRKVKGQWQLRGTAERVDAFQLRQRPLLFTAPRTNGMWCWPVVSVSVHNNSVSGTLGAPEF